MASDKNYTYNPPIFQGFQYQAKPQEFQTLQQSIQTNDRLRAEQQANLDKISEYETKALETVDYSEQDYVKGLFDNARTEIAEASKFGDLRLANNTARQAARNLTTNVELISKQKYHAERQADIAKLKEMQAQGAIDGVTLERWMDENKYDYSSKAKYDENGNLSSVPVWNDGSRKPIVRRVNYQALIDEAISKTSPKKGSDKNDITGQSYEISEKVRLGNKEIDKNYYGENYDKQWDILQYNDLFKSLESVFKTNPAAQEYLEQEYKDKVYQWNKLNGKLNDPNISQQEKADIERQLNDLKEVVGPNGVPQKSAYQWLINRINPQLQTKAYNYLYTSCGKKFHSDNAAKQDVSDADYVGYMNQDGWLHSAQAQLKEDRRREAMAINFVEQLFTQRNWGQQQENVTQTPKTE